MRVGIMGGTFDPVHLGHLLAAEQAREAAGLDEVWFMPSYVPPHKAHGPLASAEERLEMVRLAVEGHPSFRVTDIEIRKGGTSYTYDTLAILTAEHPQVDFSYIIGADMVMYLPKWYRITDLTRMIGFIGLARPGWKAELHLLPEEIRSKVMLVPMLQMELSSTEVRNRLREGRSIWYQVPDPVRRFIEGRGLYGARHG
ncbi:nicotinate-nucleotide adenylyltransferase [Gorillibacterium sp. sgz5001074]|uniref:nicotinate-nucleotide adenylyltransferase n=1 Tax=Gorillibacterium sp. sgz5001074 TaxID=3446695 RepID=UPI003F662CB0